MRGLRALIILILALTSQIACGQSQTSGRASNLPPSPSPSQAAQQYPNLKRQATELTEAFNRRDFDKVVALTYPKLVDVMGGHDKMAASFSQSMKEAEAHDVKYLSNSVGEPQEVINIDGDLYAIVPTTMKLRVPEGVLVGQAFLLGVSKDGGQSWTFVDGTGGKSQEQMKFLFPAAADKLKLPELKPPVLQKEQPNNR